MSLDEDKEDDATPPRHGARHSGSGGYERVTLGFRLADDLDLEAKLADAIDRHQAPGAAYIDPEVQAEHEIGAKQRAALCEALAIARANLDATARRYVAAWTAAENEEEDDGPAKPKARKAAPKSRKKKDDDAQPDLFGAVQSKKEEMTT